MKYLFAIISGSVVFAGALPLGYRSGLFDMVLFRYSLIVISSAVVVTVSRPWKSGDGRSNPLLWSVVAWLATVGCVIFGFAINFIFSLWYGCSHEVCMP
jgi:hypothetical protein